MPILSIYSVSSGVPMSSDSKSIFITGIDDATKCPCIGSIFLAGVVADPKTIEQWKELGVKDSKLVSPKKREKLAKIIKETAKAFTITEITPQMIDDKKHFNLNAWEMLTIFRIIKTLQQRAELHDVIIDNWEVSQKLFKQRFRTLLADKLKPVLVDYKIRLNRKKIRTLNIIAEHYADETYTIVGAASILAKVSSDAQYRTYRRKYGDFGSGSPGDPKTRLFVWQHRHNPLPIIRTSWNTFSTLAKLERIEDDPLYIWRLNKKQNELSFADIQEIEKESI